MNIKLSVTLLLSLALTACDSGSSHWDNRTLRDYEHYLYTETYDCTTDTDCEEKYPCGDWYGNNLYDESMSEGRKQEVFEKCLDEYEGRQE